MEDSTRCVNGRARTWSVQTFHKVARLCDPLGHPSAKASARELHLRKRPGSCEPEGMRMLCCVARTWSGSRCCPSSCAFVWRKWFTCLSCRWQAGKGCGMKSKGLGSTGSVGLVMSSSDVPLMPLGVMNTPPKWSSSQTHATRQQSCCAQEPMAHSREHVPYRFVAKNNSIPSTRAWCQLGIIGTLADSDHRRREQAAIDPTSRRRKRASERSLKPF